MKNAIFFLWLGAMVFLSPHLIEMESKAASILPGGVTNGDQVPIPPMVNAFIRFKFNRFYKENDVIIGICDSTLGFIHKDTCQTFEEIANQHGMQLILPVFTYVPYGLKDIITIYGRKPVKK